MFGVWDELLYILMFGLTAGQVDVLNARSNFMNKQLDISPPGEKWRHFFFKHVTVSSLLFLASTLLNPYCSLLERP